MMQRLRYRITKEQIDYCRFDLIDEITEELRDKEAAIIEQWMERVCRKICDPRFSKRKTPATISGFFGKNRILIKRIPVDGISNCVHIFQERGIAIAGLQVTIKEDGMDDGSRQIHLRAKELTDAGLIQLSRRYPLAIQINKSLHNHKSLT